MALDYDRILNIGLPEACQETTYKDTIVYALAVGIGADPTDERQLRYVYEKNLVALPTLATMLCRPPLWFKEPEYGVDWVKFLHAEQGLTMHRSLPAHGRFAGRMRVTRIADRGPEKGAYIYQERTLTDRDTGELIATLTATGIARGNGGFGGPHELVVESLPQPTRDPDVTCSLPTLPQSALLYRLTGDPNPLHADPAVAQSAGFARPILHGLCTYGIAAHAILRVLCDYDGARVKSFGARFSAPVYPGDTLRTDMWLDGDRVAFKCTAVERETVVLTRGQAVVER